MLGCEGDALYCRTVKVTVRDFKRHCTEAAARLPRSAPEGRRDQAPDFFLNDGFASRRRMAMTWELCLSNTSVGGFFCGSSEPSRIKKPRHELPLGVRGHGFPGWHKIQDWADPAHRTQLQSRRRFMSSPLSRSNLPMDFWFDVPN